MREAHEVEVPTDVRTARGRRLVKTGGSKPRALYRPRGGSKGPK